MKAILAVIVHIVNTRHVLDYPKQISIEQCFTHLKISEMMKCFYECTREIIKSHESRHFKSNQYIVFPEFVAAPDRLQKKDLTIEQL